MNRSAMTTKRAGDGAVKKHYGEQSSDARLERIKKGIGQNSRHPRAGGVLDPRRHWVCFVVITFCHSRRCEHLPTSTQTLNFPFSAKRIKTTWKSNLNPQKQRT